jgi:hypothetical protein
LLPQRLLLRVEALVFSPEKTAIRQQGGDEARVSMSPMLPRLPSSA